VDTSRFVPAASPPSRPLTLLLGGTQYARYRVDAALRTLAIVRRRVADARLLIAGTLRWPSELGPRADADRFSSELGVHDAVELLGPYSQIDAPAVYHRADLLLHTKYNDPCPTVVIEAMACGLPVVCSRSGGVPELVGHDAGVGVPAEVSWDRDPPPDPDALADAVLQVCDDRDRYAAAARQRAVRCFDVQAWLARHERVFASLAG
jgi:glycosyltransferase involved in cell wall biosynthesis